MSVIQWFFCAASDRWRLHSPSPRAALPPALAGRPGWSTESTPLAVDAPLPRLDTTVNETSAPTQSDRAKLCRFPSLDGGSGQTLRPGKGQMLSHFGRLRHQGVPLTSGTRYILAGFVRVRPLAEMWQSMAGLAG